MSVSFWQCLTFLILGFAYIVLAAAVLKVADEVEEIFYRLSNTEDGLHEADVRIDALDQIIQEIEKRG